MKIFKSRSNDVNKGPWWLQDTNLDRSTEKEVRSKDGHVILREITYNGAAVQNEKPKLLEMGKFSNNTNSRAGTPQLETQKQKPQPPNGATLDLIEAQRERKNAQMRIYRRKKMAAETAGQREERLQKKREWRMKRKQKFQVETKTKQIEIDRQYRLWALMIVEKQQTEHRNRKRRRRDGDSYSSDSDDY